ncbi:MAG: hypothetical protein RLW61_02470 [Gammaproteobacteria bacterium]
MEVEFVAGEAGCHEAAALARVVRRALAAEPADSAELQLLEALRTAAEAHLARPEFAELTGAPPASADGSAENGWWRRLFGPSRREMRLSAQRIAALERAARAERSSFEALAETARVARERDVALARLVELERELEQAQRADGPQ